jgi:hypothetical protein
MEDSVEDEINRIISDVDLLAEQFNCSDISDKQHNEEPFCCLCGVKKRLHNNANHKYFEATPEHRCITCGQWFYQHNYLNSSKCFDPYVRL